jgi:hypothetical protein
MHARQLQYVPLNFTPSGSLRISVIVAESWIENDGLPSVKDSRAFYNAISAQSGS